MTEKEFNTFLTLSIDFSYQMLLISIICSFLFFIMLKPLYREKEYLDSKIKSFDENKRLKSVYCYISYYEHMLNLFKKCAIFSISMVISSVLMTMFKTEYHTFLIIKVLKALFVIIFFMYLWFGLKIINRMFKHFKKEQHINKNKL